MLPFFPLLLLTSSVAAAIAMHSSGETEGATEVCLTARGGTRTDSFEFTDGHYHKIFLKGPAIHVFSGSIEL